MQLNVVWKNITKVNLPQISVCTLTVMSMDLRAVQVNSSNLIYTNVCVVWHGVTWENRGTGKSGVRWTNSVQHARKVTTWQEVAHHLFNV